MKIKSDHHAQFDIFFLYPLANIEASWELIPPYLASLVQRENTHQVAENKTNERFAVHESICK